MIQEYEKFVSWLEGFLEASPQIEASDMTYGPIRKKVHVLREKLKYFEEELKCLDISLPTSSS